MPPCGRTTTSEDFQDEEAQHLARLRAALIGIAAIGSAGIARADIKDYEFKLVEPTVAVGKDKIVTVQLVNKTTGKPVPDAVIFATRLDMAPEGMPEMVTKIAREPGSASRAATASRRPSAWKESGCSRSAQRCKARPGRSKPSSSSRRRNEARHHHRCRRRRLDSGGGWRIHRCPRALSFGGRIERGAGFAGGCADQRRSGLLSGSGRTAALLADA